MLDTTQQRRPALVQQWRHGAAMASWCSNGVMVQQWRREGFEAGVAPALVLYELMSITSIQSITSDDTRIAAAAPR
jgi:hypothetical protein